MTAVAEQPVEQATGGSAEPVHQACCVNIDSALCGATLTGEFLSVETPLSCRVCDHLLRENFCPLRACPQLTE
jgi:hypothetical protein